jgi:hypothetical protein
MQASSIKYHIFAFLILIMFHTSVKSEEIDPAIAFYLEKVDSVLSASNLFSPDISDTCLIKSYYEETNYRGESEQTDTTAAEIVIIGGKIIIGNIIDSADLSENTLPDTLRFDKPWELNCDFDFFPNDTGAGDLTIGFDPKSDSLNPAPTGMIIFNRDNYHPTKLFLHYRKLEDLERYSLIFEFSTNGKSVRLDSLLIQGNTYGFFSRQYFRRRLILEYN